MANYYKTYSALYNDNGYLPLCKRCLGELFESYIEKYGDIKKALKRICMAYDLYYSDTLFDTILEKYSSNPGKFLGSYIKNLNLNQYRDKTFDDVLQDEKRVFFFDESVTTRVVEIIKEVPSDKTDNQVSPIDLINNEKVNESPQEEKKPSAQDINRWGDGLEYADYATLNTHYKLLKNANPNVDSNQEVFIIDLCYTNMLKLKALREGRIDDYNKMSESYRKSFKQAGLKTVKDTSANEDSTLGITIADMEQFTPAEYYRNKKLYKDFDGIGKYFVDTVLRPLRNLMHGTKDKDPVYYVKDEEKDYGD